MIKIPSSFVKTIIGAYKLATKMKTFLCIYIMMYLTGLEFLPNFHWDMVYLDYCQLQLRKSNVNFQKAIDYLVITVDQKLIQFQYFIKLSAKYYLHICKVNKEKWFRRFTKNNSQH